MRRRERPGGRRMLRFAKGGMIEKKKKLCAREGGRQIRRKRICEKNRKKKCKIERKKQNRKQKQTELTQVIELLLDALDVLLGAARGVDGGVVARVDVAHGLARRGGAGAGAAQGLVCDIKFRVER